MRNFFLLLCAILWLTLSGFGLLAGSGSESGGADTTPPEVSSGAVTTDGDYVILYFTEAVDDEGLGGGEFDVDCSITGDDITMTPSSGDGTSIWTFATGDEIQEGETCHVDFDGDTDEVEDAANNDLADFASFNITNNSEQGDATAWAGFSNTAGVPNSPSGDWENYVNLGDRQYCTMWTATEDGEATHLNIRISSNWSPGAYGSYAVLYNGNTMIGYAALSSPSTDAWTGELSLTEETDLTFSTNDVLRFGIAYDGDTITYQGTQYDDGGSSVAAQYETESFSGSKPPNVDSWSSSATAYDIGAILRYEAL